MRQYSPAIAAIFGLLLCSPVLRADPPSVERALDACIEAEAESVFRQSRKHEAILRVSVGIVDDVCDQTVLMLLWQDEGRDTFASGVVIDHGASTVQLEQVLKERSNLADAELCQQLVQRSTEAESDTMPVLETLARELFDLKICPVPPADLILHGIQYKIRIESGLSSASYEFYSSADRDPDWAYPLDLWSQRLQNALRMRCLLPSEQASEQR